MVIHIAVGFCIGILAGLGVGSGGLLILYLSSLGIGQFAAQGLNLAVFSYALIAAMLVHLHRRNPPIPLLLFTLVFGAGGATVGALLARQTNGDSLRSMLGVLLLVMGAFSLFRKTEK